MNQQEVLQILGRVKAVITNGHFVYASGMHGKVYVNKDAVYPELEESWLLAIALAEEFFRDDVEVVIGPAVGAALFARDVARELTRLSGRAVRPVFADKISDGGNSFAIKRGYDKIVASKRVLVIEDVFTTGGSVKKVVEAVRLAGGIVVGIGAICNRGGVKPENVGYVQKLVALLNLKLDSWAEADCPMCKQGILVNTEFGKGREFLARKTV